MTNLVWERFWSDEEILKMFNPLIVRKKWCIFSSLPPKLTGHITVPILPWIEMPFFVVGACTRIPLNALSWNKEPSVSTSASWHHMKGRNANETLLISVGQERKPVLNLVFVHGLSVLDSVLFLWNMQKLSNHCRMNVKLEGLLWTKWVNTSCLMPAYFYPDRNEGDETSNTTKHSLMACKQTRSDKIQVPLDITEVVFVADCQDTDSFETSLQVRKLISCWTSQRESILICQNIWSHVHMKLFRCLQSQQFLVVPCATIL